MLATTCHVNDGTHYFERLPLDNIGEPHFHVHCERLTGSEHQWSNASRSKTAVGDAQVVHTRGERRDAP